MIGVVADDTTGANDIGIMFRNVGYMVKVLTYKEDLIIDKDCHVIIIDTDSRLDSPGVSYEKVYNATKILMKTGCSQFYKKTCSVFRGNIGAEFDAMMDALNENFAIVSLAFPKNGRETLYGIHTVNGKLLEESEFAKDPVHPMKQSNLISILQEQTKRKVALVDIKTVRQGVNELRKGIEQLKNSCNYLIVDSQTQDDLRIVAKAVYSYRMLAGSSAIAEELPVTHKLETGRVNDICINDRNGVLIVSGSLMPQTKAQTDYLKSQNYPAIVIDQRKLFTESEYEKEIKTAFESARDLLKKGQDVLVMTDNAEETVTEANNTGNKNGMDSVSVSKLVSSALADVTNRIVSATGLKRLIIAGGDTSGTICRKLGIDGNYILEEIAPGLPSGLAIGKDMIIVLKSGSFGDEYFLSKAIAHLKMFN